MVLRDQNANVLSQVAAPPQALEMEALQVMKGSEELEDGWRLRFKPGLKPNLELFQLLHLDNSLDDTFQAVLLDVVNVNAEHDLW